MAEKEKEIPSVHNETRQELEKYVRDASVIYMPGVSINIVAFNYRNGKLKILVMGLVGTSFHMLPGGYVMKSEDLDDAAVRIFKEWTGLQDIPLEQFYTSGKADRTSDHLIRDIMEDAGNVVTDPWFDQRKISVCYFVLLNEHDINPVKIDFLVSEYEWMNLNEVPVLLFDHNHIISKAIQKMQDNLDRILAVRPLFKAEFTMQELQKLYEAVFQKTFTRTNFQRRMLNLDVLERTGKQYSGKAHKAPYLYRFRENTVNN